MSGDSETGTGYLIPVLAFVSGKCVKMWLIVLTQCTCDRQQDGYTDGQTDAHRTTAYAELLHSIAWQKNSVITERLTTSNLKASQKRKKTCIAYAILIQQKVMLAAMFGYMYKYTWCVSASTSTSTSILSTWNLYLSTTQFVLKCKYTSTKKHNKTTSKLLEP